MGTFTFTGNQGAVGGTSFAFMADVFNITGIVFSSAMPTGLQLQQFAASNNVSGAGNHFARFSTFSDGTGMYVRSVTAFANVGNESTELLTGGGMRVATSVTYANAFTDESEPMVRDLIANMFAGDDDFTIRGTVSAVWGDYQFVPVGRTVRLGSDVIVLSVVSLATGFNSVTIYGDAQSAGVGSVSIAGNDIIDGRFAGASLTLYGDFQSVSGAVTYGNDVLYGSKLSDVIYGDSGTASQQGGNDIIFGMLGNDTIFGGGGNDIIYGGDGADAIDGGAGFDFAAFSILNGSTLVVDMLNTAANTLEAAGDTYTNIEGLIGRDHATGLGNDDLRGDNNANTLRGMAGDDILHGRGGNDLLDGGAGNDIMHGGTGDDIYIVGSAGDQTIELANEGTDTVRAYINWTLAANVERLELLGSAANGTGNALNNTLVGNSLANVLTGGGGNDYIRAGAGNDTLHGGTGNDTLIGGLGADKLYGGAGNDTFLYEALADSPVGPATRDTIYDFVRGEDRINLAAIDANANVAGNQAFSFIGTAGFSGVAGQLRYTAYGNTCLIDADVNGDRIADFQIAVAGQSWMTGTDFIL